MTTAVATTRQPLHLAGIPTASWIFGIRIWVAVVIALAVSFWLQLEAPASAAITVAILAEPTRGRALEKAFFRLIATIIGLTAAIVIVGLFSQARDLILTAFAVWLGLCVYAAGLLDGNRAYAAVLAGYSVALVAIQQLDAPGHVFESSVARGAAIAVGVCAIALVNDLLAAPDSHPLVASRLMALHRRVRDYARTVVGGGTHDPMPAAALLGDVAALRPEIVSLAAERDGGAARCAAARNVAVALVAEVHAVRALGVLGASAVPALRDAIATRLDREDGVAPDLSASLPAPFAWALSEAQRRDDEVRNGLVALRSGTSPRHAWRTPLYRSHRMAMAMGIRAAACLAFASVFFVLTGWPSADVALAIVAVLIGLGATTPNPQAFPVVALIATPIVVILSGILEFLILDGVTEFPLLALALAPFMIGAAVAMTLPHPLVAAVGRLNLIFILVILSPNNPQTYDAETFLFSGLFLGSGAALLVALQLVIPPTAGAGRQRWLLASAHNELDDALSNRDRRWLPEEAMFRDAARIRQMAAATGSAPQQPAVLQEILSCFDQAATIRLTDARLVGLMAGPFADIAAAARTALQARDPQRIKEAAHALDGAVTDRDAGVREARDALLVAGTVVDAARHDLGSAMERKP